jgi:cysteine desulfurase
MSRHYLDHASTTPLRPEAREAMVRWLDTGGSTTDPAGAGHTADQAGTSDTADPMGTSVTADPGRVHTEGRIVRAAVEDARDQVAAFLGVRSRQVVFTSGGTEAINTAVWGATRAAPGRPVVLADVEHSAVRESPARWAPIVTLPVGPTGRIDPDSVTALLKDLPGSPPAALVHCQWANHEVGTFQPVTEIVALCRELGVLVHVDAVAACGHVPLDLAALGADLVSISAHKLGGPPGIGALIVRRGLRLDPLLLGGGDGERPRHCRVRRSRSGARRR